MDIHLGWPQAIMGLLMLIKLVASIWSSFSEDSATGIIGSMLGSIIYFVLLFLLLYWGGFWSHC